MASTANPPAEAPESGNSISRIFGAIFSPRPTFASIARRPTWLVPLLLLTVVSTGAVATLGHTMGWRALLEQQIQKNPSAQRRIEQLTPEQRQQMVEQQMKIIPITVYVGGIVGSAITLVTLAAVFLGVFNLVSGVPMGFKTSLSIVAYAYTPRLIYGLLAIPILFLKDPSTVDPQNMVASNPAVFLADGAAGWLATLLGSLDLFSIWVVLLLSVGYSAVNPKKLSFGKAFGVIFGVWLVYVLVRVGIAAAFS
ncbi:MAG: YIP1 family protein [Acidobacteriia bacterium]|nr:YIP1 family protein [Terriglobia bacterium]